jgi:hypothetical protein
MDTTQLLLTTAATLGVALVGLMAVVPAVMEARSASGTASGPPPVAKAGRPHRGGGHHWPVHLAV